MCIGIGWKIYQQCTVDDSLAPGAYIPSAQPPAFGAYRTVAKRSRNPLGSRCAPVLYFHSVYLRFHRNPIWHPNLYGGFPTVGAHGFYINLPIRCRPVTFNPVQVPQMRTYPQFAAARLQYLDPQNIAAHPRSWTAGPAVTHTVPIPLITIPSVCTVHINFPLIWKTINGRCILQPCDVKILPECRCSQRQHAAPVFPDALQASGIIPRGRPAARI